MKVLVFLFGVSLVFAAWGQEIVTLQSRPGVTQSFFIAGMGKRSPEAVALLMVGGGGAIHLRTRENGQIGFQQGNFLPRSRRDELREDLRC